MHRFNINILLLCLVLILNFSCTSVSRKDVRSERKTGQEKYRKKSKSSTKKTAKRKHYPKTKKKTNNRKPVKKGKLEPYIEKYWGVKYKMGATGPYRFDCSGFMLRIFKEAYGIKLPRTSRAQAKLGKYVSKKYLKYGDLVFFNTFGRGISHVGVYIGNNKFAHASTSKGITISDLDNVYYKKKYVTARRIF